MDEATLELMRKPRCGLKDNLLHGASLADKIKDVHKVRYHHRWAVN
jgi:hypothetical protein